jgi:hypothetical protein
MNNFSGLLILKPIEKRTYIAGPVYMQFIVACSNIRMGKSITPQLGMNIPAEELDSISMTPSCKLWDTLNKLRKLH